MPAHSSRIRTVMAMSIPTIADLKMISAESCRAVPTGKYSTNRNGSRKAITEYVHFAKTVGLGEMTMDEWHDLMVQAVQAEGKQELLEKIKAHCRKLAWLKDDKEITEYALKCLSSGAYRAWNRNKKLTRQQAGKLKRIRGRRNEDNNNSKAHFRIQLGEL